MILEEQKYSLAKKQSILLLPRLHHHSPPTYSPHSTFTEPCMRHTAQVLPGLQRWETKKFWGEGYNSCRPLGFIKRYPLHVLLWHESHTCSLCPASLLSWPPQAILGIPWHLPDTQVWRTRLQITPTLNSETDITSHSSQGTVLFSAGQNTVSQQKNTRIWVQVCNSQTFWPFWSQPNPSNRATCQTFSCMNKSSMGLWKQSLDY